MQAIDIQNAPIDQLRADFWSIMNDNINENGDNLESQNSNEEAVRVQPEREEVHIGSRV